jgi:tellurite resistance protein TerC
MTSWLWLIFIALAGTLIVLDLTLLTRRPRSVSREEGRTSVALWLLAAIAFSLVVSWLYHTDFRDVQDLTGLERPGRALPGPIAWLHFVTCYVVELALSFDNLAVLAALHVYYRVPTALLARVLFWSILLSIMTRLLLIAVGAWFIAEVAWIRWALVGVILLAMLRMLALPDEHTDFDAKPITRLVRRLAPLVPTFNGQRLFTRAGRTPQSAGRLVGTPLLLVVLLGGVLDAIFAVDSVPALLSVTPDPLIAFTASAFALLGLRSLYFALYGLIGRLRYLRIGLVAVLLLILAKMILAASGRLHRVDEQVMPTVILLGVLAIMGLAIGLSIRRERELVREGLIPPRPTPIQDLSEVAIAARRNVRKIWILIAGTTVILVGILIAPLPGPGPTILVPIGLGILATEFVWARRLLETVKSGAFNFADVLDRFADRAGLWFVFALSVAWWIAAWKARYLIEDISTLFKPGGVRLGIWFWLVIFGSPFMPLLLWSVSYVRRWLKRGGEPAVFRRPNPPTGRDDSRAR